jgi:mRNA-degrading endonuclease RelE of RelBE toxin-antitoxin system
MVYNIIPSTKFKREAKRLLKKYPSLKKELIALNEDLQYNPSLGISLGNNAYKMRISIKSKSSGKSGGGRIITYVISENKEVYLLTIYDKAEYETVDDKMIKSIIAGLNK